MSDTSASQFYIGPSCIGTGGSVYVIAEAGVNHDGDPGVARELIDAAADARADAVKFQVFSADRLVTRNAPAALYQQVAVSAARQYDVLAGLELQHGSFAELARHARQRNIEFLATPFSTEDMQFLVGIGVRALKLASPDIANAIMIDAAARSGLPIIASTGAAELAEIAAAVDRFRRGPGGPLALLHCISSYPAPETDANLAAIRTLATTFDCVAGFSDHTESLTIGGYAVMAGARIIEKHLTLDRARKGPDHSFSLRPDQMADYIRNIRHAERLLGDGIPKVSQRQKEVRQLARASVVAVRDIPAGQTITRDMLAVKRPAGGIAPSELAALIGRRASRPIAADTPLVWEAVN